jgi:hypothetical protein
LFPSDTEDQEKELLRQKLHDEIKSMIDKLGVTSFKKVWDFSNSPVGSAPRR